MRLASLCAAYAFYERGTSAYVLICDGDRPILAPPVASFRAEMQRMKQAGSAILAKGDPAVSYDAETVQSESADVRAALRRAKLSPEDSERILAAHQAIRERMQRFVDEHASWQYGHPEENRPVFPSLVLPDGLPDEFADYLQGASIWRNPAITNKSAARAAWERLLDRPPDQRRYKSTWAAFMLGRSYQKDDPEQAIRYFVMTRKFAKAGFADSTGLAAASLGWEARAHLDQTNYERAVELYLDQLAADDPSAIESLWLTCGEAIGAQEEVLEQLAKNPRTQPVVTTYWISSPGSAPDSVRSEQPANPAASRWLRAAEAAGIIDPASCEKLALLAFQNDEFEAARHWTKKAGNSPIIKLLQAKLLFRDGKVRESARLFDHISQSFPLAAPGTNDLDAGTFLDNLHIYNHHQLGHHVLAELGALELTLGSYLRALDHLLHSGYWPDAAYVAERVLTLDELKTYVDSTWPAIRVAQGTEDSDQDRATRERIRYLLARRLYRATRADEARAYYPPQWLGDFDALNVALTDGWDEAMSADARASALLRAAAITRRSGMELLGTEVEPDWHCIDGDSDQGVAERRATNSDAIYLVASVDELRRAATHHTDPDRQYHYRYRAAALAWQAAKLMPDNSSHTALVLWIGGSFIKYLDPNTADLFYKALVRRNRNTELGAEADRRHWFPHLNDDGSIIPREAKNSDEPAEESRPQQPEDPNQLPPGDEEKAPSPPALPPCR